MAFMLLLLIILLLLFLFIYISGGRSLLVGSGRVYILLPMLTTPQGVCLSQLTPSAGRAIGVRSSTLYFIIFAVALMPPYPAISNKFFRKSLFSFEILGLCSTFLSVSGFSTPSHGLPPHMLPFCKGRWRRGALTLAVRVQGRPDRCLLRARC